MGIARTALLIGAHGPQRQRPFKAEGHAAQIIP